MARCDQKLKTMLLEEKVLPSYPNRGQKVHQEETKIQFVEPAYHQFHLLLFFLIFFYLAKLIYYLNDEIKIDIYSKPSTAIEEYTNKHKMV